MVVACLFAGVGAWGATFKVDDAPTYAAELFGSDAAPEYPKVGAGKLAGKVPMVVLTIPQTTSTVNEDGGADITFTLTGGAKFAGSIGTLMYDGDLTDNNSQTASTLGEPSTASQAQVIDGGRKDDASVTIRIGEEGDDGRGTTTISDQTVSFALPKLSNLQSLAAGGAIYVTASSVRTSGSFKDGDLTTSSTGAMKNAAGASVGAPAIKSVNAATLKLMTTESASIVIDGDSAFTAIKVKGGTLKLGTVTVTSKNKIVHREEMPAKDAKGTGEVICSTDDDGKTLGACSEAIATPAADMVGENADDIYDRDGEVIDEGLRGTINLMAAGSRGLFNEDDMIFLDYDGNGKKGAGEELVGTGASKMLAEALSADPDDGGAFSGGKGTFNVYYTPGGKGMINHDSMIKLTATLMYSDPGAVDEKPAMGMTTLNFDGVSGDIKAYAIPHSTNGNGDKGNVRVRCEQGIPDADGDSMCRVFLECWNDTGDRLFGEAPMIAEDSLAKWSGADIEGVVGDMDPSTRHSCRVLSKGEVSVQQLTRDGHSSTLVNNTYVGTNDM